LQDRLRQQLGNEDEVELKPAIRAGMQLGTSRGIRLPSLQALTECTVQIAIDGQDQVLASPFSADPSAAASWVQRWQQWTTLSEQPIDNSRININQASFETLMTIQGMTESIALAIMRTREARMEHREEFATVHWLVARGLISPAELRKIAPECTTGGDVQTGIAVGQLEGSRTCSMIQFTVDSRFGPSRLVRRVDLPVSPAVFP
jgi:DNA uptake protein ComE-like DNA-binding protein